MCMSITLLFIYELRKNPLGIKDLGKKKTYIMCMMCLREFNFVFAFLRQMKDVEKLLVGDSSLLTLHQQKSKMCWNFSNQTEYFMTNILILERKLKITEGKRTYHSISKGLVFSENFLFQSVTSHFSFISFFLPQFLL